MRYFVSGQRIISPVLVANPKNPQNYDIVELGTLQEPLDQYRFSGGEAIVAASFDVESELAKREIKRLEVQNPITHRALREFILGAVSQLPAAQTLPGIQRVAQVEAQITALRAKIK